MTKMKKIAAMTAALLICAGNMGYMPESTISIGSFTANAAEVAAESVKINESYFPDAKFRQYIADNFDKDGDGVLSAEEIAAVTEIDVDKMGISDLTGVQYFENLKYLRCSDNNLTEIDVTKNINLTSFVCSSNKLTTLDVSNNKKLNTLFCNDNHLPFLDLYDTEASIVTCFNNVYEITSLNTVFDLSTLPKGFDVTKTSDWTNATVEGNILTIEDVTKEVTYTYNCGNGESETFTLIPPLASESPNVNVAIDKTNFPDAKFRQYIADNFDKDGDGVLSAEEIKTVTEIRVSKMGISDLTGVEKFIILDTLICEENNLTALDLSNNKKLTRLYCDNNQITSLDLKNNTALEYLFCADNFLTSLDLSNNKFLSTYDLDFNDCDITLKDNKFDLSTLPKGFDITKASEWENATIEGNIITFKNPECGALYQYDCGNGISTKFGLRPVISTEILLGDINNDGTIDSIDASSVLAHYAAVSTGGKSSFSADQIKAADVNKDEKSDSIDASLILAYYAHTSTGGTGTIEDYLSNTDTAEQLKALREKKESEVQLFAAAYIGCTDDMNEVDAVKWIKENSPVFYENYSFVEDIPSGQIAGTPMGELYCIVPFDENSTVAINRIVRDENGNGSYENVIYRSESGEPVLLFCNNTDVNEDTMVTITDSDGNKDVWFPGLDEKLMMNCPYNANYDTFVYDFTQYQEILEKEHTSRKKNGWKLPTAADLQFTYWSGVDYRGSEVIGSYQIEFSEDTAYIKWVDGDEEHEFKDVEWQLEVEQDAAVVTFNFNEFAGILQYNFLWNENNSKLYTAVNFTNEDTLDENLKLYRILDRYEYSEPIS